VRVSISLCAVLRDHAGSREGDFDVPEGATLADAIAELDLDGGPAWIACVNGRPAPSDTPLAEGDSLYVFLPVSGG
jgi:sulfur carrier protein ThiS